MSPTIYVPIALAAGFALGVAFALARNRVARYQNHGEELVAKAILANFEPPGYHLLNHVTLPLRDGTTQVDHILVSRFGVFVIETKDYNGWIFGNAKQPTWTQVMFMKRSRFQNPIFQNFRHVRALQDLLDFLPQEAIRSIVVFTGDAEFKTEVPAGVFDLPQLIDHIREYTTEVMSLNRLQFCVGRLETIRLAISKQTDVEHIQNLVRRRGAALPLH